MRYVAASAVTDTHTYTHTHTHTHTQNDYPQNDYHNPTARAEG